MELWIRSQDKETLLPIDKPLMYWESIDNIHTHSIIFKESPSYIITLGTYKTKERASEVLDEIQKLLKPIFNIYEPKEYDKPTVCTDLTPSIKVYEMPKE